LCTSFRCLPTESDKKVVGVFVRFRAPLPYTVRGALLVRH
jgi:hypothetical protein